MDEQHHGNLGILYVEVINGSPGHPPARAKATLPEVRDCLSLCQKLALGRQGKVVKANADSVMLSFADAGSAMLAACEMQLHAQHGQLKEARNISIRTGVHFGLPIIAGVAAQRVALLAGSGEIFTTAETLELLSGSLRAAIRQRTLPSRTKQENVTVYEVMWQTISSHGRPSGTQTRASPDAGVVRLRLVHLGREIVVTTKITIGRQAGHNIVLKDPLVSRNHAYIEPRQGRFVLVDLSSHGTLVSPEVGEEYTLKHGEAVLQGSGVLAFAHGAGRKLSEIVSFRCEPGEAVASPPTQH